MEELIKVSQNEKNENVVDARELHEFLEIKRDFTSWVKQMIEYGFEDGKDFTPNLGKTIIGRPSSNFAFSLDMAKEIAMVQRNEKGKQARQYFIECEKALLTLVKPLTRRQVAEQLLASEILAEELALKVDNLSTALDVLVDWVSIIKVAQFNKVSETLFSWNTLKKMSKTLGVVIKKAESPRFGYQNLYHVSAFKACYPQFRYDFLNDDKLIPLVKQAKLF